jgi:hypothetical protein
LGVEFLGVESKSFSKMISTERETTMSIGKSGDEKNTTHTEAFYEELACQEEIYLEEREEAARAILVPEDSSPVRKPERSCDASSEPRLDERVDTQVDHATEELITGDSDDPPLSEEAVAEMLKAARRVRF